MSIAPSLPRDKRVRVNANPRNSSKPRFKKHLAEWQRTICGLKIADVPIDAIVDRPSKVTCGSCKLVLKNRRKRT